MLGFVRVSCRPAAATLVACAALLAPATAEAGNGLHPRTPVVWDDSPCVTIVDRSVDPTVDLTYAIPFADTDVTEDEVTDSRTHQFLAFCRDKNPQTVLPNWVAWADVVAAGEKPLDVDPAEVQDANVLDLSREWSGCWDRVTEDADRRPITDAVAAQPVVWDTTGLDAGPWVVYGYTYEPAFNVYVRRSGFIQVVDDLDPAATGPGAAITTKEQILYKGGETTFEGCLAAMEGSTIDLYWSIADESPEWVPFVENEPVMGTSLSIPFVAAEEMTGKASMIRLDVTDPMGRTYSAHMTELVMVLLQDNPNECDDGGSSFVSNPGCDPAGSTGEADDTGGDDANGDGTTSAAGDGPMASTGPAADGGNGDGGKCSVGASPANGPLALGLFGLGLLGWRRRR